MTIAAPLDFFIAERPTAERERLTSALARGDVQARVLLTELLTIRPPDPIPAAIETALDVLFATERATDPAVDASTLPPIADSVTGSTGDIARRAVLWRGDLTHLRADAIVNAANSAMLGCFVPGHACIDNAIHAAAGPALRRACAEHMESQGSPERTGRVTVTPGFHLSSRLVFHTVGPIVRGPLLDEHRELLTSCYVSILDAADELGDVRTLGFCAISTGVFGYPKEEAAHVAVATIDSWLARHPDSLVRPILSAFTDFDEQIYIDALVHRGRS